MHTDSLLLQGFVYLAAAVLTVPIAKRLGLGSVLGYLIAGVLVGPFALGLIADLETVQHYAEYGVVMMLFLIGLELDPRRLWRLRGPILGLGGLQVGLSAALIFAIALALGETWRVSLAIGLTLALSSTAIVLQTFREKGLMSTPAGQAGFSVLLFQDIAVIPILALMPLLAIQAVPAEGAEVSDLAMLVNVATVIGVIAAIILGGRYLARPVFRIIASTGLREMFTAFALLLVVGVVLAMQAVGLSPALGSFLAGVVFAESEYRHELESDIEPFKGLLLGLFFITVGAGIDFGYIATEPMAVGLLVLGLLLVKLAVLVGLGLVFRMDLSQATTLGIALAQGGEFGFVLFALATDVAVIGTDTASMLIAVVALSMLLTPLLFIVNDRLIQPLFQGRVRTKDEPEMMDDQENPVIIAGFGRFGQIVARMLISNGFSPTLLDHDPSHIERLGDLGFKVFYGDARRVDLLTAAGAGHARLLIVSVEDQQQAINIVETARKHFPGLRILARAYDRVHMFELMRAGVDDVARETFGSAASLGEHALKELGFRGHQARRAAQHFSKRDRQEALHLYELWGDDEAFRERALQQNRELHRLLEVDAQKPEVTEDKAWESVPRPDLIA